MRSDLSDWKCWETRARGTTSQSCVSWSWSEVTPCRYLPPHFVRFLYGIRHFSCFASAEHCFKRYIKHGCDAVSTQFHGGLVRLVRLGAVDLENSPVFREMMLTDAESDGWGAEDMAEDAVVEFFPVLIDLIEQHSKCLHRLLHLLQP